jgi:alpha-maltose-1-phosphate synthase
MNDSPKTLSIMEDILGHSTNGLNMRKYFNEVSSYKNIDFYWYSEEREFLTKLLMRPLHTFFPNRWIQRQNLDFSRFRVQTALAYTARRLLERKLKQKDYRVMHLSTQVMGYYSINFMRKIPTVIVIDITSAQASKEFTAPGFRWTYSPNLYLDQRVFDAAARIITLSEWAHKSVVEDFKVDENKVITIPYGVDTQKIQPPYLSEQGKKDLPYQILFVGGDFQRKGGQDLLDVFLAGFSDKAELHLVTTEQIECQHPNVHVYNDIKAYTEKWHELYSTADVFVMPTYADAFATVFMEAMAAGLPVIATTLPQISEVVIDGETGFVVRPGDRNELAKKIQVLMDNPSLGLEMGAKGRKIAEQRFDSKLNFQRLESIFREVALAH